MHSSTYLDVPKSWLGEQFIIEAEHLKVTKPDAYKHEYLGEAIGTGGQVFDNVTVRRITTEEREQFDRIRYGLDFGYAADPLACVAMHYDATRRRLYLLNEIYQTSLRNAQAVELIQRINPTNKYITADSAEPRTIAELNGLGLRILPAKKGPDSVNHGIKWLTDLDEIIIDPDTCRTLKENSLAMNFNKIATAISRENIRIKITIPLML